MFVTVITFNVVIAHVPGAQNTAADYLTRLEADPKNKLVTKIREDVQTLPIEINVQSARISQEEQPSSLQPMKVKLMNSIRRRKKQLGKIPLLQSLI